MTQSESQEPVFAFMADPATHGGAAVERIDTHATSVFLAGGSELRVRNGPGSAVHHNAIKCTQIA
jgi:hypothetical protein